MKNFKYVLFASFAILPFSLMNHVAQAGGSMGGNGGNAVVCPSSSIQMFDYWEMNQARPIPGGIQLGSPDLSVADKIELALKRIEQFDPTRAAVYRANAKDILDHLDEFLADTIPTIDDGSHDLVPVVLPCIKVQFAVQMPVPQPGKRRFQIDSKLYGSPDMTNDARAGIILHEVIYREAISLGQTNSDKVRYFNYTVATSALDSDSGYATYISLLNASGFSPNGDFCQPVQTTMGRTVYVNAPAGQALIADDVEYTFCRYQKWTDHGLTIELIPGHTGGMFYGNRLSRVDYSNWTYETNGTTFSSVGEKGYGYIFLQPNGMPDWIPGDIFTGASPSVQVDGKVLACVGGYNMQPGFSETGDLNSCYLQSAIEIKTAGGEVFNSSRVEVDAGHRVSEAGNDDLKELTVTGTKRNFLFNDVYLDSTGAVTGGVLHQSTPYTFQGYPTEIQELKTTGNGQITATARGAVSIRFNGKRITSSVDPDSNFVHQRLQTVLLNYCTQLGFTSDYSMSVEIKSSTEEHVGPYEEFYDAATGNVIGEADEDVAVLDVQKACQVDVVY